MINEAGFLSFLDMASMGVILFGVSMMLSQFFLAWRETLHRNRNWTEIVRKDGDKGFVAKIKHIKKKRKNVL